MSDRRFFSSDWSLVEALKPRLQPSVRLSRHRYRGRMAVALSDDLTGSQLRISPMAWRFVAMLNGETTVDAAFLKIVELCGDAAPSQDRVIALLAQLHAADMLSSGTAPQLDEVAERRAKKANATLKRSLIAPMSIRIPLFNPDPLLRRIEPWLAWVFGPFGVIAWVALIAAGLIATALNWAAFVENIPDQVLAAENLLGYALVFTVIKVIHEFGHGLVAARFGAQVREFGIMFLVFFPVPYVDATEANALPSKWRRAAVAAAGMWIELAIAAGAMLAWAWLDPGPMRAICHSAVLVAGLSTVLVNGNPLLRFDGYFVLTDLLEIPNLAKRSNAWWQKRVETRAFGRETRSDDATRRGEAFALAVYAPAAFVYRIFLSFTIALFVAAQYLAIGIALGLWSMGQSLVWPALKGLRQVFTGPALRQVRVRSVAVTCGSLAVIIAITLLVPLPKRSLVEGVVWLPEESHLRAETSGLLLAREAQASIAAEMTVARIENDLLLAERDIQLARVQELARAEAAYRGLDAVLLEQTRSDLETAQERLEVQERRIASQTIKVEAGAQIDHTLRMEDTPGRWVSEGEVLATRLPQVLEEVRLVLDQKTMAAATRGIERIDLAPAAHPTRSYQARSFMVGIGGEQSLPSAALALQNGGKILVDPADETGTRPLEPVFVVRAVSPDLATDPALRAGMRVIARLHHPYEPIAPRLYAWLRDTVLDTLQI